MGNFIGIDTSNYTTSCALFNNIENKYINSRRLLGVKQGNIGLRQSDVLFHHIKALPDIIKSALQSDKYDAIGVSDRPRPLENSYMPCFLAGVCAASAISAANNIPLYKFSHQAGHIAAALYSANRMDLVGKRFISFHVSGGTTEAVLTEYNNINFFDTKIIAQSLDLKMGQAIDRIGKMLELSFPAGKELDNLSLNANLIQKPKPCLKGLDCSISGLENKAQELIKKGVSKYEVALYTITFLCDTLDLMTERILAEYGNLPLVYAGGVMSNTIIRKRLMNKYNACFASNELSGDNAVGISVMTAYLHNN